MSKLIISEAQAERVGRDRTGGEPGEAFKVILYEVRPARITAFAVEVAETGQLIRFEEDKT